MTVMVDIRSVHKSFGSLDVLKGIDLAVRAGEVTVILGPSGSGKSTLLRTINHLEKVDRGAISMDGALVGYRRSGDRLYELREREVLRQRTRIGFVFQNFNLFPHLTVLDNLIEAPVSALKRPRKEAVQTARRLLDRVGLAEKADASPRHLSGGQQLGVPPGRSGTGGGWRSPGRSRWSPGCSSSTNRPPRSTPNWPVTSSTSSRTWPIRAPR
jgi:polar amino acid transport system ATP-binding protein